MIALFGDGDHLNASGIPRFLELLGTADGQALLDACEHLEGAGMPPADSLRQAITEHGLGVTFEGGSVANPLLRPLKLVQAYMGHLERTAGDPPYPGAVAAARDHSSAVLQHRSPAQGYFLVSRGRIGQEQRRGGVPARGGYAFATWAFTAAQGAAGLNPRWVLLDN